MASTSADPEPEAIQHANSPSGITTNTLNRAQRRNAVNPRTAQKLFDAFQAYEADASQKVCVFHGANDTFCAGADPHEISRQSWSHFGPVQGRNIAPMAPSRLQIRKPVVCAVSGYAVAGGLELSLLGDMRVVEEDAVFGVFCRRFVVPLIDGGTVRLQAIVGLEALAMGLANRVVPKGKGLEEAIKVAEMLLAFPQLCMNVDRESCYNAVFNARSLEDALKFEFDNSVEVVEKESIEGATRFAQGQGRSGKL